MVKKRKIYAYILSIVIGQIIALLIWFLFKENYFIPLFIGSIFAIVFGYKGNKKNNEP